MIAVLVSGAIALVVSLFGTPLAIRALVRRGYGQLIRDDGPTSHHTKRGTPTMGGAVIILATLGGYAVAHLVPIRLPTVSGLLVLFLMTGLGLVGMADDYIKISKQRSLGLRAWTKVVGQGLVAVLFGIGALMFENDRGLTPASAAISFIRDSAIVLPAVLFVLWAFFMIIATSNAVNLTDGLDGLATGTSVMVCAAYMVVAAWQLGQSCEFMSPATPKCYEVRDSRDLAVVAAALLGACFGFLWWNAAPAKIFMGDTGSLALGGAIAGLAITTRTELLLVLLGGLFAIITTSVIVQVGWFKATGKRVFRMAPLQHHFELKGWGEVTIVIRFWIIAGLCVALGLGVFYADWVTR
ncbi:MAG: phospho-N-acetylmuramoyl-pentapeptide-transferase [Sporichthyaceae bacterium]|jgi:phospho-N-acetylmuramoyl-pentapeptide-transferase|nr:phospho-N-acetylmuramoyl-pentapeptide-transferase [Sporichthyaceae bacterium]